MVDADLQTATAEIAGEFEGLDVKSVLVTTAGIGVGLFSAEFFAEIAGNMFGGASTARTNAVEILTKFGVSGGAFMLRRFVGGPLIGAVLILAAVGASTSGVLQMVEVVMSMVGSDEVQATAQEDAGGASAADGADIDASGYNGDGAEVSV